MEEGTPDELMSKGGWFYNFANAAEGRESSAPNVKEDVEHDEEEEVEESEGTETKEE